MTGYYPLILSTKKEGARGTHANADETEEIALENIKDAIRTYLESIEDLNRLKKLRTVEVTA